MKILSRSDIGPQCEAHTVATLEAPHMCRPEVDQLVPSKIFDIFSTMEG